jgi:hypothetical protein
MPLDDQPIPWQRGSRCESSACVEVAILPDRVLIRDSAHPEQGHLEVSREAWAAFVAGLRAGALTP